MIDKNIIKMQNLKDRLKLGGTKQEFHDLAFFSPFVKDVMHSTFANSDWYVVYFEDGTAINYEIKER